MYDSDGIISSLFFFFLPFHIESVRVIEAMCRHVDECRIAMFVINKIADIY